MNIAVPSGQNCADMGFELQAVFLCGPGFKCLTCKLSGRYEDSARRYGRWASEGLLAPAQLSSVLTSYAEELMMTKAWAGNR